MLKYLVPLFPKEYKVFVDVFGGSGSVLLSQERPRVNEVYNDLGQNVYSLYKVISDKEMMTELRQKLELTPYSEQFRNEFMEDLQRKDLSLVERAYKFMYVSRTSYNGQIDTGGYLSITNVKGRKISKDVSCYLAAVEGLEDLHKRLSTVVILNRDAFKVLDKYDDVDAFLYIDPPYIKSTRKISTKYEVEMTDEEHKRLVDKVLGMKSKIMISAYDHPIYDKLQSKFERHEFTSPFSTSNKIEVVWTNYKIERN